MLEFAIYQSVVTADDVIPFTRDSPHAEIITWSKGQATAAAVTRVDLYKWLIQIFWMQPFHTFSHNFARCTACSCASTTSAAEKHRGNSFPCWFLLLHICLLGQRMTSLQHLLHIALQSPLFDKLHFHHFHKCQRCHFHNDLTSSSLSKSQFSRKPFPSSWACNPPHPRSPPRRWLHWCGARCRPSCHKTVNLKPNQT